MSSSHANLAMDALGNQLHMQLRTAATMLTMAIRSREESWPSNKRAKEIRTQAEEMAQELFDRVQVEMMQDAPDGGMKSAAFYLWMHKAMQAFTRSVAARLHEIMAHTIEGDR